MCVGGGLVLSPESREGQGEDRVGASRVSSELRGSGRSECEAAQVWARQGDRASAGQACSCLLPEVPACLPACLSVPVPQLLVGVGETRQWSSPQPLVEKV